VPVPPHRKTVNDWHEAALAKLNERMKLVGPDALDLTLHGLRHTAAASWLACGHNIYLTAAFELALACDLLVDARALGRRHGRPAGRRLR
jgi:integrase